MSIELDTGDISLVWHDGELEIFSGGEPQISTPSGERARAGELLDGPAGEGRSGREDLRARLAKLLMNMDETGRIVVGPRRERVSDIRNLLGGWRSAQSTLSGPERQLLAMGEALLAGLDEIYGGTLS